MSDYLRFLRRCVGFSFQGGWRYHAWMTLLTVIALIGLNAYARQLVSGLGATGMSDQVSWGLYIANFTFLVGVAAAAVMMVIPAYVYKDRDLHHVVIFGELLAVAVIVMCLCFVTVDLGRPDRIGHMLVALNFPSSMLAWDVIVLSGYLVLNLHICGYLIYRAYQRREPDKSFYVPFVFVAIAWAISIHTVTAFLLVGLGARPFWNSAIIVPRFIASAFAAGPALIILTLQLIKRYANYDVPAGALQTLRQVVAISLTVNLFMLGSELFTEFYTDSTHVVSAEYLFFGLGEANALVPWIWPAVIAECIALGIFYLPAHRQMRWLNLACVFVVGGIWVEKGMGLIVTGQIPSPLGEVVEYTPTANELLVTAGIWAFGALLYTIFVRISVPVLNGELTVDSDPALSNAPAAVSDSTSVDLGVSS